MTAYLIRRLVQMLIVLLVSSMAIYAILNLAPGGPLTGLKQNADRKSGYSQADIVRMEKLLGIDKPLQVRYVSWLAGDDWMGRIDESWAGQRKGVLRGDFGDSWKAKRPVSTILRERLRNTILLMTTASVLAILVAVPVGVYSAVRQYSRADYFFTFLTFIGIAIPAFWFGLMLIITFALKAKEWGLPYFPAGGVQSLRPAADGSLLALVGAAPGSAADRIVHLILPTMVLSLLHMASWTRFVRSSMLEVLRQDYVRTARAKGLNHRVVVAKHALRNALIPLVTIVTFEIPNIFGGAVLTETVFSYPGMGRLYIQHLGNHDWPVVQGFLVISAILVVVATLLSDILYTVVDPRIRY
jgi:peptide/nickel transport system permease protein